MSRDISSWSYISSQGYSIEEDSVCRWRIKKNGEVLATGFTPYPILNKALKEKWLSTSEVLEIAALFQIPVKYLETEEPNASTHSYSDLGGYEKY